MNVLAEKIEQLKKMQESIISRLSDETIIKEHDKMKQLNTEFKSVETEIANAQAEWDKMYLQLMESEEN